jgi:class 3 adenylate cyclase/tetratricopeptide (TPR) repeat protein
MVAAPSATRFGSPDSYTPQHLAERILTSKAALEGERKQVTVLFADMKGSMELLAGRDPEEARKILDPVLERIMAAVHRYEGTVNQVMGDGIMALFGAPIAHEDHAVRACYAALRMQESVKRYAEELRRAEGISVQIRVGLNSGEVVVRSIGNDLHMDYTAVGHTTHLAARMEQMATPGSILVSPETLNLAEGYVVVKPLGPMPVKGLAAPIEVYEVMAAGTARSRLHVAAARGLTRFVGRGAELEELRQALELARSGHGQVVAVVGEPGVGKSRLYWEFTHSHRTQGWLIVESVSVSYGKATAFLPIIDFLRTYFQIEARDEARKIREKVTGKVLLLDRALELSLPALLWLLDVPVEDPQWQRLDPEQRRQRTLDGVKRLLLRESQVQPLLVIFEDLHWIDAETQALLDSLVESVPTARLLLLVNYRLEYQHDWGSKSYYRQLRIDPLPPESIHELLEGLLGNDAGLQPIKQLLIERTEGNPFFLEESVRTLIEAEVLVGERGAHRLAKAAHEIQVPSTAQAILAARIDRLSPEDKRLLQAASVIGKDVPFGLLQAIAERSDEDLRHGLARLQAAEFLYETRLFPDLEYTFKHALTHEVAYGSLLHERRRSVHVRIVKAIEDLGPDHLREHIDRLARHAFDGEEWEKAATYAREAGAKAAARSAHREAVRAFEQALSALDHLPASPERTTLAIDLRFDLRNSLHALGEFAQLLDHLHRARALAERLGDQRRLGWVISYMSQHFRLMGAPDEAIELGERVVAMARGLGDFALETATNSHLGPAYRSLGQHRRAADILRRNVEALNRDRELEHFGLVGLPTVISRTNLVWTLADLGEFAEGAACGVECIRVAEAAQDSYSLIFAYLGTGMLALTKGEMPRAIALAERAVNLCRTSTVPALLPMAASLLGSAYALSGRFAEALPLLEEAVQRATSMSLRMTQGLLVTRLAEGYLLAGKREEAQRLAPRGLELSREFKDLGHEAYALRLLGDVAAQGHLRDATQAEELYTRTRTLAEKLEMLPLLAHCHLRLGKLYGRLGKSSEATTQLTIAATMFRELDMALWRERTESLLSRSA